MNRQVNNQQYFIKNKTQKEMSKSNPTNVDQLITWSIYAKKNFKIIPAHQSIDDLKNGRY